MHILYIDDVYLEKLHLGLIEFLWKFMVVVYHRILLYGMIQKSNDFYVKDKDPKGQPKKFENDNLQISFNNDNTTSENQIAVELHVS